MGAFVGPTDKVFTAVTTVVKVIVAWRFHDGSSIGRIKVKKKLSMLGVG